jgi:hypothetical protein
MSAKSGYDRKVDFSNSRPQVLRHWLVWAAIELLAHQFGAMNSNK